MKSVKPVSDLLHRTPWWALILAGLVGFFGLVFFAAPYHIIQYRDDGKTAEESRAIKREIDNAFAENAINLGRGVVKGMLARTNDPDRRAELEQALRGLEDARQELRDAGTEVLQAKRDALEAAREATRNVQEALRNAQREARDAVKGNSDPAAAAMLKAMEDSLRQARRAEREAEKSLRRAERAGPTIRIGPEGGNSPSIEIDVEKTPPEPGSVPAAPPPSVPAPPAGRDSAPAPPAIAPELANKIRHGVTGDMVRIGIAAALVIVLVPLFIVAVVIKFFVDRSRASQRMAESKRKEAEYHRMSQQVTEAKLAALQAQVEPHFLYNTLASVQALTEVDPARASEMTGHLIQYLRNALPKMRESVSTVGQEVELVRAYLSILQMRMGERLKFSISVPESLFATPFPPLMLPSLVENAIKHGLEPQREGGAVEIGATLSDGRLRLVVADTGRGFSDVPGAGVGLANIRERLAALYGESARFTLEANEPHGVVAAIEVPAEGTRSAAPASEASAQPAQAPAAAPQEPMPAPPPILPPQPVAEGFWPRAWEVLTKVERGWRIALYYLFLVLVGVAGVVAVGFFIGASAGLVPVVIDNDTITGPSGVLVALAAAVLGFVLVSLALAIVMLVLYALGFFLFGLLIFVAVTVLIALSPVLAPFLLLALLIWWMARRRKAARVEPPRIEPTLAK